MLVKRAYWWLPLKADGIPYQGAPSGGWSWITEPGTLGLGPRFSELVLPSWLPQQVLITRCLQGYGCSAIGTVSNSVVADLQAYLTQLPPTWNSTYLETTSAISTATPTSVQPTFASLSAFLAGGDAVEFGAYIDPGGQSYGSTHPPGQESNMDRNITIMQGFDFASVYEKFADSGEFNAPVLWDRSNKDRLVVFYANSPVLDWVYLQIHFLTEQDVVVPSVGQGY